MSLNSPDVAVISEPEVQKDAMKAMAGDILAAARAIIAERHLETTPRAVNFAWTVLGNESGKGYTPSFSAIELHETAESGTKSSARIADRRINQITDPKLKEEAKRTRDISARSLSINFDEVSEPVLQQTYGNEIPKGLVQLFAEKLGFTQPDERIDANNPRIKRDGNIFTLSHPDKPYILEIPIRGQTYGQPDFRSFVARYTPK